MKKTIIASIITTVSFITIYLSQSFNLFNHWDLSLSNFFYQTENRTSDEIALVIIDEETINSIGRWQDFTRADMAKVINNIAKDKPAVIGLDINYTEKSTTELDKELENSLKKFKNTVLVNEFIKSDKKFISPLKQFSQYTKLGFANVETDPDGIVRHIKIKESSNTENHYSFSTEILRKYFGLRDRDIKLDQQNKLIISKRPLRPTSNPQKKFPPLSLPLDKKNNFYINYFGKPNSYKSVSLIKVLKNEVPKNFFNKKIVLIGATTFTLHDAYLTPVSKKGIAMPGVEIHANIIQTTLSQQFLLPAENWIKILTLAILSILISFICIFWRIPYAIISTIIISSTYTILSWGAFGFGIILSTFYPAAIILFAFIISIISKYLFEAKEKRFLRSTFSRYVSSSVVDQIMSKPDIVKLGGERRNLTIMFSDLGNFTTFSEKMTPENLVEFMNNYLSKMTDIILEKEGTLDKYEGDAIMAFWGAPTEIKDHPIAACEAAYLNLKEFKKLKESKITLRIGLHSGDVIVGNFGSEKRFDYSVMGDNVNLASRLEGVNKIYGTSICVSKTTYLAAKSKFIFRKLDIIRVKGKSKPVEIYELIEPKKKEIKKDFIKNFESALTSYRNQDWEKAKTLFKKVLKEKPNDQPTKIFLERIKKFEKNPPHKNWKGIYDMTSK